jgi:hypothetical protein
MHESRNPIAPAEHDSWSAFVEVVRRHHTGRPVVDDDDCMERSLAELRAMEAHVDGYDPWRD